MSAQWVPPPKQKATVSLALFLSLFFVALIGGCGTGFVVGAASYSTDAATPRPTVTVTETASAEPEPEPEPTHSAVVEADKDKDEKTWGDGDHIVGKHIEPGTYRTTRDAEDVSAYGCWAQVDTAKGTSLAYEYSTEGRTVIRIPDRDGAVFRSQYCGTWKRVKK